MIRCHDISALVELYVDGEIDPVEAAEIEVHVESCDSCRALLEQRFEIKDELRALAQAEPLDAAFRARIDASLLAASAAPAATQRNRYAALAAAVLLGGVAAAVGIASDGAQADASPAPLVEAQPYVPVASAVFDESVRWHSRPLPVEVTGPDQVLVGDWFRGKVDFPVSPPDFARRAHLLGGRLGNVSDNDAAVLVYDVDGTKLSVVMFDASESRTNGDGTAELPFYVGERNGYNVAFHEHDGVAYTFTTNLPDAELRDLVNVAFSY